VVVGLVSVGGYLYWKGQPPTVTAEGRMDATSARVVATTAGRVALLTVEEGSGIEQEEVAAWIEDAEDGSLVQLVAPLSGQVTSLEVRQGENVVAGDVVAEIYQTDSMVASLEVEENSIQRVDIGQRVVVTSGSLDLETTGRVISIALTPLPPDPTVSERTRKIRKYIVTELYT
jgi:HlyD family secretion protein